MQRRPPNPHGGRLAPPLGAHTPAILMLSLGRHAAGTAQLKRMPRPVAMHGLWRAASDKTQTCAARKRPCQKPRTGLQKPAPLELEIGTTRRP